MTDWAAKEREDVKAAFQANPTESPVRILLATDAASEGIDLQNHCHLMIHLEIPYNPNVMEQRNGRIDRHGQRASEVVIWHPVDAEGGRGDDILRALRKLDAMRADMGSVNPVIAPQLPDLLEGRRAIHLNRLRFRIQGRRRSRGFIIIICQQCQISELRAYPNVRVPGCRMIALQWHLISTKVGSGLGRPWHSARLTLPRAPPPPGPLPLLGKPGRGG